MQRQLIKGLKESAFIVSILLAVFLLACLWTYHPLDPGPFQPAAADTVNNIGRFFGAWLARFFLLGFGYIAYLVPPLVVIEAHYLFGETLGVVSVAGMLVCVVGVYIVSRSAKA